MIITGVSADGLDESFLGRKIDDKLIEDLKKINIHLGGEGGEYDTFVLDCPLFKKRLNVKEEAQLVSLACTKAPPGYSYWTLDLLEEEINKKRSEWSKQHLVLLAEGDRKKPTLTIIDRGEGQLPQRIHDTIVGLNETIKQKINFVFKFLSCSTNILFTL